MAFYTLYIYVTVQASILQVQASILRVHNNPDIIVFPILLFSTRF